MDAGATISSMVWHVLGCNLILDLRLHEASKASFDAPECRVPACGTTVAAGA
jgi:hypothetical protein